MHLADSFDEMMENPKDIVIIACPAKDMASLLYWEDPSLPHSVMHTKVSQSFNQSVQHMAGETSELEKG